MTTCSAINTYAGPAGAFSPETGEEYLMNVTLVNAREGTFEYGRNSAPGRLLANYVTKKSWYHRIDCGGPVGETWDREYPTHFEPEIEALLYAYECGARGYLHMKFGSPEERDAYADGLRERYGPDFENYVIESWVRYCQDPTYTATTPYHAEKISAYLAKGVKNSPTIPQRSTAALRDTADNFT